MAAADRVTPARNRSPRCSLCSGPLGRVRATGANDGVTVCAACASWGSQARRERVRTTHTRARQAGRITGR